MIYYDYFDFGTFGRPAPAAYQVSDVANSLESLEIGYGLLAKNLLFPLPDHYRSVSMLVSDDELGVPAVRRFRAYMAYPLADMSSGIYHPVVIWMRE